ncbi:MAG: ankyrin repeat domain-containing protein, partial [Chlamydiia bacterium]|nr:ankyrin repeat domain-containing protein [Chlamydiia bacterium]
MNLDLKDQGRSLICLALVNYKAAAKNAILSENMAAGCEGPKVILDLLLADPRVDVNSPFPDGSSPLHFACEHCETILPQLLKREELALNPKDKTGKTPLHYGAANGPVSIVEKLCQAGADVNAKDNQGRSPLTWAFGRRNRVCVMELLKHKPEVTSEDKREAADKGWPDVQEELLSCDANKELLKFEFLTYAKVLEQDTRAQAGKVFDAISKAVDDTYVPAANTCDAIAEIIEDYQGSSGAVGDAIQLQKPQQPVEKSFTSCVTAAFKAFCNCNTTDAEIAPKDVAIEDFWELPINGSSEKDCPDVAEIVRCGNIDKIKALTRSQVNTKDALGFYPIQYARKKETIEALVQAGAKLDIETDRESGDTLLHDAVCEDNAEKIQILQ